MDGDIEDGNRKKKMTDLELICLYRSRPDIRRLYVETAGKLSLAVSRGREFLFQVLAFKITLC